jgi:4-diphosphocytidyl-2-C-methyl-D-erythritol kinase
MSRALVFRPTAKINLTLHVGGQRKDGFHDVRTLLQSIALTDRLLITPRPGKFNFAVRSPGVPDGRDNLVWRAAELLWRDLGRVGDPRDVHVKLDKRIPSAAGLGGGSADAAAALVGLNEVWGGKRRRADLASLGAGLGSDVPFFLVGGTALGVGRGEEIYALEDIRRLGVIVIKPSFGVTTADAYRWYDEDSRQAASAVGEASSDLRSLDVGWPTGPVRLGNDLQAPVARRHPDILAMVAACLAEGAYAAAMTGSGSAVFGLFSEAAAPKAVERLQRPGWLVLLTRTMSRQEASRRMTM